MTGRTPQEWDERYAARPWPTAPSPTVVSAVRGLTPGRVVDLAAGTGRHALWLAARGWRVTAVDTSEVGLGIGRDRDVDGQVDWVRADARTWEPSGPVDLVLVAHAQLGPAGLARTTRWLAPGGHLVVVGHARGDLRVGGPTPRQGPRDPALRMSTDELAEAAAGLAVLRLEEVERPDEGGPTVDVVLIAQAPAGGRRHEPSSHSAR